MMSTGDATAGASRCPTDDICALGVADLNRLYRSGTLSPVEVVQATLNRIERLNPTLNAYLVILAESAMAAARAAELQLRAGIDLGPLHGIPVSIKDNINVLGTRTTAGSRVLQDAPLDEEDAAVVRRLRAAGAIVVGKTNLYEFGFGDPDPEGPFGAVQNPRKVGHQCGSSSSGSAAAVAAGLGILSLGTDTGGSIRHPASVCGVVGLKPTYGLVPVRGIIPSSPHLDHVGPLGRSVVDVAAGLAGVSGLDRASPCSSRVVGPDHMEALKSDVRGLRLGLPTNQFYQFGQPAPLALVEQARRTLVSLGLVPLPIELPLAEEANDINLTILRVDLVRYHQRHRGREALYGRHFLRRLQPGYAITAIQYAQAVELQIEIRQLWQALFERVDVLLLPANTADAPAHGEDTIEVNGESYPVRTVNNRFSRALNLTGFPSLVIPVGETPSGSPIGIQLVGPPFGEARLLAVGYALEQAVCNLPARWGIEPRRWAA